MESSGCSDAALECGVCTKTVLWQAYLTCVVDGWVKRRCLASDPAIRARVERVLLRLGGAGWCLVVLGTRKRQTGNISIWCGVGSERQPSWERRAVSGWWWWMMMMCVEVVVEKCRVPRTTETLKLLRLHPAAGAAPLRPTERRWQDIACATQCQPATLQPSAREG